MPAGTTDGQLVLFPQAVTGGPYLAAESLLANLSSSLLWNRSMHFIVLIFARCAFFCGRLLGKHERD
jgi:hypothetical protein